MEMNDGVAERDSEKRKEVMRSDSKEGLEPGANYRAYPKPLAKYEDVVADPELFKDTLMKLHAEMGTKFMVPIIGGKGLDLHRLFVEVTSRGGIEKVIAERRWREVTAAFSFPSTATNASFVLRKYYLSLLQHYEQIYLFGSQGWNLPNVPSNTSSTTSVSSQKLVEPVKSHPEAHAALHKRRRNSGSSPTYPPVVGVIDGKFEHGYFVTVTVGSEKLKGVLYHISDQAPWPLVCADESNLRSPRQRRCRKKLSLLDPNHPKPNRSGYNFFFAEQHARLKPLHPGRDREISRIIGVRWNGLTETEKAVYQERGLKDKERYKNEMAVYNERVKAGQHTILSPIQQLPVQPMMAGQTDTKSEKVDDDVNATDEDCFSSDDSDSDDESSHDDSEMGRSLDRSAIESTCLAETLKEEDRFELRRREDEKLGNGA
ncbi:hypothetical protein C4D60_Mb06t21250 [Musa balbisiana]|uniref:HMG box domain-containing protein n=1 Tax=Musa balbisiana TaxID=52838 RepID=A0A4S8IPQ5_MUSBA|nr:hypothetical protein C4D60_Mb06t21250 [Musa balbisiana]